MNSNTIPKGRISKGFVFAIILLMLLQIECLDILVPKDHQISGSTTNIKEIDSQMSKVGYTNQVIDKKTDSESLTSNSISNPLKSNRNIRLLQTCSFGYSYQTQVLGTTSGTVAGSNPYASISSLSAAAVHAGLVKFGQYGTIKVENLGDFQSGSPSNTGTCANGVCSQSWYHGGCRLRLSSVSVVTIPNCDSYSGGYCSYCSSGYTLKNSNCVKNQFLDSSCSSYSTTNPSGFYICSSCSSGSLTSVISSSGQYNKCLTSTALIRDCTVYQYTNNVLNGCSTCSTATNISPYTTTVNGQTYTRCLNSVTQYVQNCAAYDYSALIYTCNSCSSGLQLKNVTVSGVNRLRCLSTTTQIVSSCSSYTNSSGSIVCSGCQSGYQLKTVSGVPKCLPDIVIDPLCTTYILNGSNYQCSQCNSASYVPTSVYTSSGTYKYCLATSTQLIRDCSVYQLVLGKYECYQCSTASNIGKYSVFVNGVQLNRCLNSVTEYTSFCSSYQYSNSVYSCLGCSTGYKSQQKTSTSIQCIEMTPGEKVTNCVEVRTDDIMKCKTCITGWKTNTNGTTCIEMTAGEKVTNCVEVKTNDIMKCQTCIIGWKPNADGTECIELTPGEKVANCIEIRTDDIMKCSKCKTGWAVNSDGTACLNLTPGEVVNHCTALNPADLSKCSTCQTGFNVNTQQTACIFNTLENCQTSTTISGDLSQCSVCKVPFRLTHVEIDGSIQTKCISYTKNVQHCSTYDLVSGQYPCKTCNANYFLTSIEIDGKSIQKCGLLSQKVDHCAKYSELTGTCVVRCTQCEQGFRLADLISGLHFSKVCLRESTEFIPDCLHYVSSNGQYFCKVGHCQSPAVSISIGTTAIERACTSFNLVGQGVIGECLYYERPLLTSTELRCQKCRSDAVQAPYCI